MEIYLCHMVLYRVVEKVHLLYITGNSILDYVIACLLVLTGAILFSFLVQKALNFIIQKISSRRRKIE